MKHLSLFYFLALIISLFCSGCTQVYSVAPQLLPPIADGYTLASKDLHDKTVALYDVRDGDPWVFCSGVWVSDTEILTTNHCDPDDAPGEPIRFAVKGDVKPDGEHFSGLRMAFITRRDSEHDLLLLKESPAFVPPVHGVASLSDNPYIGEAVQTDGHPMGLWWTYSQGIVSAVRRVDVGDDAIAVGTTWIQSTAPISPGNSGGGLFDSDGNLLGICSRGISRGQNLNLYVHVQYIRSFLVPNYGKK